MTIKCTIFCLLLFGVANLGQASEISCSPAPCATANVQVTPTSSTADAMEFAVGSTNNNGGTPGYSAVSVGSNYYVSGQPCNASPLSKAATWSSPDPGATSFSGGCVVPPTNWKWATDAVAASYVPSAGSTQKIFVGHIVGSPSEANEDWNEVMLKNSSNGGSTWSAYSETAEPVNFDSGDPNRNYSFDNDGLFIDGSSGIYNGCGYIGILNENFDNAKQEIEGAVGCPAETAANWSTVKIWDMPSTDFATDFARLVSDQDDATYVFATWSVCPTKNATTGECASIAGGDTAHIYFSSSTNNGSTWATPTNIFDVKLSPHIANTFLSPGWGSIPNTGERTSPIPQLVAYGSGISEKLVIVYQTWNGSSLEVNYRTSTDKGVTWSSESHVNSQTHDQFMPCMAIGNQGSTSIGPYVAWLDRRNDTNNKKYDAYAAFWNGTSFTHVTRLSSNSSDPHTNHLGTGSFIGEYIGCNVWTNASNSNEYFLVTWPDTSLTTGMVGMLAGYLGN